MKQIQRFNKYGELVASYETINKAWRSTGINGSLISRVVKGESASAGGFFFQEDKPRVCHDLSNRFQYKLVHLYRCGDGVNIHTTRTINLGDTLMYKGKIYTIGKADGMSQLVKESETIVGCNYYEFTVREVKND